MKLISELEFLTTPFVHRKNTFEVWHNFVTKGIIGNVPKCIKYSWERCRKYGIDPKRDLNPIEWDPSSLQEHLSEYKEFQQLLHAHYDILKRHFEFLNFSIFLTDPEGYVLSLFGHEKILRLLERGTIKVGRSVAEAAIGTSAPGLTLKEQTPSAVVAGQHYSKFFHWAGCIAVPIFDEDANLIACLDFTTTAKETEKLEYITPAFLNIAYSLQFLLSIKQRLQRSELFDAYFQTTFEYAGQVMFLVNASGNILNINANARDFLREHGIRDFNTNILHILNRNIDIPSLKINPIRVKLLSHKKGRQEIFVRSMPLFNNAGQEIAYLIVFEKTKAPRTVPKGINDAPRISFDCIVTQSEKMLNILNKAKRAAVTRSNILLEGETGTGKELFAKAIHYASPFRNGPFVAINCCAIPSELVESELFGYEKGAYTGALREGNIGKFELANGGTLFLDEIHTMDRSVQMKLLRAIEERKVTRIGGKFPIPVNIRIISASSKNLAKEVENGNFIEPLYFRLNVVKFTLPTLKERKEDIPLLVQHFIQEMNKKFSRCVESVTPEALDLLTSYPWPGNVRELKNCIESAFNFCSGRLIGIRDLPEHICSRPVTCEQTEANGKIEEITKRLLSESLQKFGSVKEAAAFLGISKSTFYRKMKKFGLSK
ncbi:MAG TPA: hypothetical protein ENG51_15195 [Deltaproteobacteria bacterium]|nr:hypothetical protein [Deltaproteobacteria bacterium]